MLKGDRILKSLLQGLMLSCILILFQMFISGKFTDDSHIKVVKIEANAESPIDTSKEEAKFSIQTYSIRSIGHISINRGALCLFEIIFKVESPFNEISHSIPSPLSGYLQTLFTSSISVNAP
jgi:hypothetical protein